MRLLGDRVIIQLDKAESHTTTQDGLIIPLNELYTSEGGKVVSTTSAKRFLNKGVVLNVSSYVNDKMMEMNKITLSKDDRVYISPSGNDAHYHYNKELTSPFDGVVCIPFALIEGIDEKYDSTGV